MPVDVRGGCRCRRPNVAAIIDSSQPYPRKVLLGVAACVHKVGNWSLYVEDKPLEKLPDLCAWRGDGMSITCISRRVVQVVKDVGIPLVGIDGGLTTGTIPPSRDQH
jgi:hypothetical protein